VKWKRQLRALDVTLADGGEERYRVSLSTRNTREGHYHFRAAIRPTKQENRCPAAIKKPSICGQYN